MSSRPAALGRGLAALAGLLTAWALVVWASGGFTAVVAGQRITSRSPVRPALAALTLAAAAAWVVGPEARRAWRRRMAARANLGAPWLAAALAAGAAGVSAIDGTHVSGGADASGYVSQSRLWAQGRLTADAPAIVDGPWPARGWLVTPLGYAPAVDENRLGPTYAPGLPWLMALGAAVAGEAGRYLWTPLAVALLTWATFLWARRDGPPAAALAAALLVATSPPVVFAAMQTMSDLPAAALWALVIAGLAPGRGVWWSAAGAALAFAIRPNLIPVAALVWASVVATGAQTARERRRRGVVLAVALGAVALGIAALNSYLWGAPMRSGYGAPGDLFQAANVAPNLGRLVLWTRDIGAYWTWLALPALAWRLGEGRASRWWPAAAVTAGLLVAYLPYAVFDEWWYLRFYLPAWPFLAAAVATGAWRAAARWSEEGGTLVVLAAAIVIGVSALADASGRGVFGLWRAERRYAAVADWVGAATAPRDVVAAVQHSGAIADLAGRAILRWDELAPGALDRVVADLAASGRRTWLVVDDWEVPAYRARFQASPLGGLLWAPVAEARVGAARVYVYDLTRPTRATAPASIRVVYGGPWPGARGRAAAPAQ
ncbi:MAG: hypothetical protein R2745_02910 [Vicinamibacterales bacterium]